MVNHLRWCQMLFKPLYLLFPVNGIIFLTTCIDVYIITVFRIICPIALFLQIHKKHWYFLRAEATLLSAAELSMSLCIGFWIFDYHPVVVRDHSCQVLGIFKIVLRIKPWLALYKANTLLPILSFQFSL